MIKKITVITMVAMLLSAAFLFAGCQKEEAPAEESATQEMTATEAPAEATEEPEATEAPTEEPKMFVLGATQIVDHPALNACREGALEKLAELGYVEGENLTVDYQDAQNDPAVGSTIAQKFVSDKVDAILAIATPSAQAAYGASLADGIPVVFSAVTDPVAAEIANEDGTPLDTITGTSDQMPMEETFKLIKQLVPDAVKVGILHNTSEVNSDVLLALAIEVAEANGMEIVDTGITTTNDVATAVDAMLPEIDVMLTLTDNMVVSSLPLILEKTYAANIPVFGSEDSQVTRGSLASAGVDYYRLGLQTGEMIAKIFDGTPASEIPIATLKDAMVVVNTEVAEMFDITIPAELMDDDAVSKVVTEIEEEE
jgi:putative ABC transport system substrate-binding protein